VLTRRTLVAAALAGPLAGAGATRSLAQTDELQWPNPGWEAIPPEAAGIDPFALDAVEARVPGETPDLSALAVVRGGRLVWERYFGGHDPEVPINTRSITKSVTGFLTGVAIGEGALSGLEQTVGETIPDRIPRDADPRIADVTIGQLLTMSSGVDWPSYGDWPTLIESPDWVATVLSRPVVGIPGETYVYNTGGSHLLGVMVAAAVGEPLERYAERAIFEPLGIRPGAWQRSPQGEVNGGSGLALTARDQARFGLLAVRGGRWGNERVVPADFAGEATTWKLQGDSTGGWEGYGYQWWITQTWAGWPAAFALGYGGQHIFIVPGLDLVVVAAVDRRVAPEELRSPRPLIESIVAATQPPA
jgi:CubicO group peptidase (beta-lactamase class C family)